MTQHKEALGRQIALNMVEKTSGEMVIVPETASYIVRATWPMHYQLHLRAGYRFPADASKRQNPSPPIGYFIAQPSYPWWARSIGLIPTDKEALVLYEDFSVFPASRETLARFANNW